MIRKITAFLTIIILKTLIISPVHGAKSPSDTVHLYEGRKRVTENIAIYEGVNKVYYDLCIQGICDVKQRVYPIKIYKVSETVPTYSEYVEQEQAPNPDGYHDLLSEYTKDNISEVEFNPSSPEGGAKAICIDCVDQNTGNSRAFKLDIKTGKYTRISQVYSAISRYWVYGAIMIGVVGSIILLYVLLTFKKLGLIEG